MKLSVILTCAFAVADVAAFPSLGWLFGEEKAYYSLVAQSRDKRLNGIRLFSNLDGSISVGGGSAVLIAGTVGGTTGQVQNYYGNFNRNQTYSGVQIVNNQYVVVNGEGNGSGGSSANSTTTGDGSVTQFSTQRFTQNVTTTESGTTNYGTQNITNAPVTKTYETTFITTITDRGSSGSGNGNTRDKTSVTWTITSGRSVVFNGRQTCYVCNIDGLFKLFFTANACAGSISITLKASTN